MKEPRLYIAVKGENGQVLSETETTILAKNGADLAWELANFAFAAIDELLAPEAVHRTLSKAQTRLYQSKGSHRKPHRDLLRNSMDRKAGIAKK